MSHMSHDPIEPKGCQSAQCTEPATHEVCWPGQTLLMCMLHMRNAVDVAEAMGFALDRRALREARCTTCGGLVIAARVPLTMAVATAALDHLNACGVGSSSFVGVDWVEPEPAS